MAETACDGVMRAASLLGVLLGDRAACFRVKGIASQLGVLLGDRAAYELEAGASINFIGFT